MLFHSVSIFDRGRILLEIVLHSSDIPQIQLGLTASNQIKGCQINPISSACMKSFIITNLPMVFSEKDVFTILHKYSQGLKRVIIADDSEISGKTLNTLVAVYIDHESAKQGYNALLANPVVFSNPVSVCWKEPSYDIIGRFYIYFVHKFILI